ncbi:MAG: DUF4920 domain-containing protein [Salibacteraceae bacterium]
MKTSILSLCLIALLMSCQNAAPKEEVAEKATPTEEPAVETAENTTTDEAEEPTTGAFGDAITADGAMNTEAFLTAMEGKDSMDVKVMASINQCCRKKGCWMTVDLGNGEEMMVRFKNYGFFVPKYADGNMAIMEGRVRVETVSVDALRHLAEDGGKSEEEIAAITEPEKQLMFEATGVIIKEGGTM